MLSIYKNVYRGAAKGCLLRLQFGYTAFLIKSWNRKHDGFQIGIFAPEKFNGEYRCLGFYWYHNPKKWWHRETKYLRDWKIQNLKT